MRTATEAAGAKLLYLPPYSPDFNPIEQASPSSRRCCARPPLEPFPKASASISTAMPTMMRKAKNGISNLWPLNGDYVVKKQPSKIAAIEGRWHDEQPAGEVLFAWAVEPTMSNKFELKLPPPFGSLIDSSPSTAQ